MPFSSSTPGYFPLNPGVCVMWATFDVLMCTASIWHMCTMSMDRYFTLKYPMKYGRNKTRTMVALKICFVWVISIGICSPVCILGFMDYSNVYNHSSGACVPTIRSFIIYGSLFAFCIPLCIMVVTYVMTIKILCDNQKLMKSIAKQQGDRKGRKERNGAYSTTYLTPNVYVPRFMERASIDTTVSGITINETSLHDTLVSSPKEETLNLATPLVPEPSPDWSKQNRLSVNQIEMEAMTKWEDRNGQAVVGEACQDPWSASGFVDQSRKPEEMEAKKEVKEDGVLNEHPTICQSASSEAMVGNRHRLLGRTNSGFSAALDPGIEGDFPLDNVTMTLASSSSTTTTSTTSGQSGFSATITSDPLNHIPTQTNFVLSSSQPHLPSALESSFSSIRTRSRLTSAPSGGESPPQDANDANGGHTTSGSSQEYRLAENANRNGKNGLKDSQQLSQGSSLSSMLSRTYWDSNATDLNESNEAASGPDLQEKLSMIEQEMDECLREITPKGQVCSGIKEHTEEEDNDIEMKINLEDGLEVSEESDESESDRESYEDPAEQSLYKADSIDEERQNGGGHITLQGIPPVLVSSPPNGSSDDTPNESDSEKSNLITIHLKASGCYLYQIEPSQSGMRPSGEENSSGPNAQDDRKNRSNPLLSIKHGDSTECSCDDLEREHDLELYCQNETEESMSESGNTKMIVHKVHPAKKKKKKLNSRIRGYTSRWHTMMRRKTCRRKSDAPICKVNGMVPPNMISKRTASNEKKASKVLGIIFAVFVVLWTPFFMMNILSVVCEQCIKAITPAMMASIVWLGYMSSLANPIIYTMFNTAFRRAFYRILTCQYPKRNAAQTTQDQILMTNASNWGSDRRNTLTLTLREY